MAGANAGMRSRSTEEIEEVVIVCGMHDEGAGKSALGDRLPPWKYSSFVNTRLLYVQL